MQISVTDCHVICRCLKSYFTAISICWGWEEETHQCNQQWTYKSFPIRSSSWWVHASLTYFKINFMEDVQPFSGLIWIGPFVCMFLTGLLSFSPGDIVKSNDGSFKRSKTPMPLVSPWEMHLFFQWAVQSHGSVSLKNFLNKSWLLWDVSSVSFHNVWSEPKVWTLGHVFVFVGSINFSPLSRISGANCTSGIAVDNAGSQSESKSQPATHVFCNHSCKSCNG